MTNTRNSLKVFRNISGLTQAQLASRLKCSQAKISFVEHGKRGLTNKDIKRLSAILNFPIALSEKNEE
jgi:transcriptional regulator with XRE-family HTH domain